MNITEKPVVLEATWDAIAGTYVVHHNGQAIFVWLPQKVSIATAPTDSAEPRSRSPKPTARPSNKSTEKVARASGRTTLSHAEKTTVSSLIDDGHPFKAIQEIVPALTRGVFVALKRRPILKTEAKVGRAGEQSIGSTGVQSEVPE